MLDARLAHLPLIVGACEGSLVSRPVVSLGGVVSPCHASVDRLNPVVSTECGLIPRGAVLSS
jgi:hypothetical protein